MQMYKFRNFILFSLIIISQLHTAFRGYEVDFVWLSNDLHKSVKLSIFLFSKHITTFVLLLFLVKPKKVNVYLLHLVFCVSAMDVIWFLIYSGVGNVYLKWGFSLLLFIFIKSKYSRWIKF